MRRTSLALAIALILCSSLQAQTPAWKLQWKKDQVLSYRVEHFTTVTEIVGGNKVETTAKLNLVKRWQVVAVDAQGVATMQLSLTALRNEQSRPNGEALIFDSANLDKCDPETRKRMAQYVGPPLAVVSLSSLTSRNTT